MDITKDSTVFPWPDERPPCPGPYASIMEALDHFYTWKKRLVCPQEALDVYRREFMSHGYDPDDFFWSHDEGLRAHYPALFPPKNHGIHMQEDL